MINILNKLKLRFKKSSRDIPSLNEEQIEEIIINHFKSNPAKSQVVLGFSILLIKLFGENPGMEQGMDLIEKNRGFNEANEWLCNILVKTGKYIRDNEGYVEIDTRNI